MHVIFLILLLIASALLQMCEQKPKIPTNGL
jgi:hypothetical protein